MRTYLLILVSIFLPAIAFAQKAITGQVLDNFNEQFYYAYQNLTSHEVKNYLLLFSM